MLTNICLLKDKSWSYGFENQLNWIQNNIEVEDIHVLGYDNDKFIAYANLVHRKIIIDDIFEIMVLGIGNVCVADKGLGLGTILIDEINTFLLKANSTGILLCKNKYVNFYMFNNWASINSSSLYTDFEIDMANIMTFNFPRTDLRSLKIIGKSF